MRGLRATLLLLVLACAHALRALVCMHAAPGRVPPRRIPGPVPKRIYVDGNNLMNQRKVTRGRSELAEKLRGVKVSRARSSRSSWRIDHVLVFPPLAQVGEVVLVYDGKPGEPASTGGDDPTVVITAGGDESNGVPRVSADDWILDAISREDRRAIHS